MTIRKNIREKVIKYIEAKVTVDEETGCWHSPNKKDAWDGYPRIVFKSIGGDVQQYFENRYSNTHSMQTHKAMFLVYGGTLTKSKPICLHSCGQTSKHSRSCCNPDHIRAGTHKENMNDTDVTSRHGTEEFKQNRTCLTQKEKNKIRDMLINGCSFRSISKKFNVDLSCISRHHAVNVEEELGIILPQRA